MLLTDRMLALCGAYGILCFLRWRAKEVLCLK
jgi:hypothetical protein